MGLAGAGLVMWWRAIVYLLMPGPRRFVEAPASAAPRSQQPVDDAWWRNLGDPVLENLLKQALESAPDIAEAQARVREARALSGFARAGAPGPGAPCGSNSVAARHFVT